KVTARPVTHGRSNANLTASPSESDEERRKVSGLQALVASGASALSNCILVKVICRRQTFDGGVRLLFAHRVIGSRRLRKIDNRAVEEGVMPRRLRFAQL